MIRVIFPVVAFGLLIWLLDRVGWSNIARIGSKVEVFGVFILLMLGIGESVGDAVAIYYSTERRLPLWAGLVGNATGAILNWFIPLEAGEAYKIAYLGRYTSNDHAACSVLVWNYILKWTSPGVNLAAATLGLLIATSLRSEVAWLVFVASLLALTPYAGLRLLLSSGAVLKVSKRLLGWMIKPARADIFYNAIRNVHEGVRMFRNNHHGDYVRVVLWQLAARSFSWMALYAASRLMGFSYTFGECAIIHAAIGSMGYVTSVLPARVGVTESTAYVLFEAMGLPGEHGLLLVLAQRVKALLANGGTNILGSLGMLVRSQLGRRSFKPQ